jgi:hypothetical protein
MSLAAKKARRVRRRVLRRKLEVFATDQGLRVLPGEPTQALRRRVVEAVETWRPARSFREATAEAVAAVDPSIATGPDLGALAELCGIERFVPEGAVRALSLAYHMRPRHPAALT